MREDDETRFATSSPRGIGPPFTPSSLVSMGSSKDVSSALTSYRDNDGSVNIIISFGWAGSPGQLILFPTELKAPNHGNFCQRRASLTESAAVWCLFLYRKQN